MPQDYTEQDTERARQQERLAAGGQPIAPAYQVPAQPDADNPRDTLTAGALIAVGAVILLSGRMPGSGEITAGVILLTIASAFLFFAFWRRIYGLMIPGAILAGLSVGVPLADFTNGASVVWGLSLAFGAIYAIGATMFNQRHAWPVIPAVILFCVGVIILVSNLPSLLGVGLAWLPLGLIATGIYLGWGRKLSIRF